MNALVGLQTYIHMCRHTMGLARGCQRHAPHRRRLCPHLLLDVRPCCRYRAVSKRLLLINNYAIQNRTFWPAVNPQPDHLERGSRSELRFISRRPTRAEKKLAGNLGLCLLAQWPVASCVSWLWININERNHTLISTFRSFRLTSKYSSSILQLRL